MADTNVADTVWSSGEAPRLRHRGPFFIDGLVGAFFYTEATTNDIIAARTGDGNSSRTTYAWARANPASNFWFDRDTPGDSGTLVHAVTLDGSSGARLTYNSFDINTPAWSGQVVIEAAATVGLGAVGITKAVGGNLVAGFIDGGNARGFYKSTDGGTNWSAIADPLADNDMDDFELFPANGTGDDNDVMLLHFDLAANTWRVVMYDDSANTWTPTAGGSMTEVTTSVYFEAKMRKSDGHVILFLWNATDAATADYECWDINPNSIASPVVTQKTNIVTNSAESGCAAGFIDEFSGVMRAMYARGTAFLTTARAKYRESYDFGLTWGPEIPLSQNAEASITAISGGSCGGPNEGQTAGRFQPIWRVESSLDLLTNLDADLVLPYVPTDPDLSTVPCIGTMNGGFAGTTTTQTVTFALTPTSGYFEVCPRKGDLVVITLFVGSTVDRALAVDRTDGTDYALMGSELTQSDTFDANQRTAYYLVGDVPDLTFVFTGGSGNANDAARYSVHVYRGVDETTPMDVAVVTAGAPDSSQVDPGSITPVTPGARIHIAGGAASGAGSTMTAGYLSDVTAGSRADTNDASLLSGHLAWTSGAYDGAGFGNIPAGTTANSWTCITAALRPAKGRDHMRGVPYGHHGQRQMRQLLAM